MWPQLFVVVGSRSLALHLGNELGRDPADWDIWIPASVYPALETQISHALIRGHGNKRMWRVEGHVVELTLVPENGNDSTSQLYRLAIEADSPSVTITPLGSAISAGLEIHRLLKASSIPLGKPKNQRDLNAINRLFPGEVLWPELLALRLKELSDHMNKDRFFNKYQIKRYVEHDRLHEWIAVALGLEAPSYKKILEDATAISENKFNALAYEEQLSIVVQEAMALSTERWLIPTMRRGSENMFRLLARFCNPRTSADAMIRWLDRLCTTRLKDHPAWLAKWTEDNYVELFAELQASAQDMVTSFPEEFLNFLMDVKTRRIAQIGRMQGEGDYRFTLGEQSN